MGAAEPESDLLGAWGRRPGRRGQAGGHRTPPPSSAAVGTAWHPSLSLASQQKQNTTKSKTNTGKQIQEVTPTGQRSPEAPARDVAQHLTRHGQHHCTGRGQETEAGRAKE